MGTKPIQLVCTIALCLLVLCGCQKPPEPVDTDIPLDEPVQTAGLDPETLSFCEWYEGTWTAENDEFIRIWLEQPQGADAVACFMWGIWNSDMIVGPGTIESVSTYDQFTVAVAVFFPAVEETELFGSSPAFTQILYVTDPDRADNTISILFDGNDGSSDYVLDTGDPASSADSLWNTLCGWQQDCYWTNPNTQDYIWFSGGDEPVVVLGNWQADNNRGLGQVLEFHASDRNTLELYIFFPAVAADNAQGYLPEQDLILHVHIDSAQSSITVFADGQSQTYNQAQG